MIRNDSVYPNSSGMVLGIDCLPACSFCRISDCCKNLDEFGILWMMGMNLMWTARALRRQSTTCFNILVVFLIQPESIGSIEIMKKWYIHEIKFTYMIKYASKVPDTPKNNDCFHSVFIIFNPNFQSWDLCNDFQCIDLHTCPFPTIIIHYL